MRNRHPSPLRHILLAFAPDIGQARIGKTSGIFRHLANGANWAVEMPPPGQTVNAAFIRSHLKKGLDGIIVTGSPTADARALLSTCTCPVATIQLDINRASNTVRVRTDAADICATVLRTFDACREFKSFAFLRMKRDSWGLVIERHLKELLSPRGVPLVVTDLAKGRQARTFDRLSKSLPRPAAIVTDSSSTGKWLLDMCRARHVAVPDEFAVIAVNDSPIVACHTTPSLSGISIDFERQGLMAAQRLEDLMATSGKAPPCDVLVGARELVVRESLPTASSLSLVQRALSHIAANVQNLQSVADVANYLHCSRRLLDLRFREQLRSTVLSEILRARLALTARQIRDCPNRSLLEICLACGWKSESRARTLFRQSYGTTMSAFRAASGDATVSRQPCHHPSQGLRSGGAR